MLRYPNFQNLYGLSEADLLDYAQFLQSASDIVILDPHHRAPFLRDPNDAHVLQTAERGEATSYALMTKTFTRMRRYCLSALRAASRFALRKTLSRGSWGHNLVGVGSWRLCQSAIRPRELSCAPVGLRQPCVESCQPSSKSQQIQASERDAESTQFSAFNSPTAFQAVGCEFDSRLPLHVFNESHDDRLKFTGAALLRSNFNEFGLGLSWSA